MFEVLIEAIKNKNIFVKFLENPEFVERIFKSVFAERNPEQALIGKITTYIINL